MNLKLIEEAIRLKKELKDMVLISKEMIGVVKGKPINQISMNLKIEYNEATIEKDDDDVREMLMSLINDKNGNKSNVSMGIDFVIAKNELFYVFEALKNYRLKRLKEISEQLKADNIILKELLKD